MCPEFATTLGGSVISWQYEHQHCTTPANQHKNDLSWPLFPPPRCQCVHFEPGNDHRLKETAEDGACLPECLWPVRVYFSCHSLRLMIVNGDSNYSSWKLAQMNKTFIYFTKNKKFLCWDDRGLWCQLTLFNLSWRHVWYLQLMFLE